MTQLPKLPTEYVAGVSCLSIENQRGECLYGTPQCGTHGTREEHAARLEHQRATAELAALRKVADQARKALETYEAGHHPHERWHMDRLWMALNDLEKLRSPQATDQKEGK